MPDKLTHVKIWCVERGRTMKDLAEAAGYSYGYFLRVVNGFDACPIGFEMRVRRALHDWDSDTRIGREKAAAARTADHA